jgi:hypothetical protein
MNYTQRDVEEARGSLHLLKKRMNSGGRKLSSDRMQTIEAKTTGGFDGMKEQQI